MIHGNGNLSVKLFGQRVHCVTHCHFHGGMCTLCFIFVYLLFSFLEGVARAEGGYGGTGK
jgi:Zn-finger protein